MHDDYHYRRDASRLTGREEFASYTLSSSSSSSSSRLQSLQHQQSDRGSSRQDHSDYEHHLSQCSYHDFRRPQEVERAQAAPHALPTRDARGQQERHDSAPATNESDKANSELSNRSDWLVLPSVNNALRLYGDIRRQEPRFSLVIRQQPRRGLAIGNSQMSLRTARSVPLDPPPVCELLIDRHGDEQLLSLPEVFVRAQLVKAESPFDECLPDARRHEPLVGDTLQSPFNSRIDTREDQSFFVFKELGVRNRGLYRLRFDLFDRVGLQIMRVASVLTNVFEVQERRKHPGLTASSTLMDALVDRGMKYKLRKATDKQNAKKRKSPEDYYYSDERAASAARRQSYAGEYDHTAYNAERRFSSHYPLHHQRHNEQPQTSSQQPTQSLALRDSDFVPSRSPPRYAVPEARRAYDVGAKRQTRDVLPGLDTLSSSSTSAGSYFPPSSSRSNEWNASTTLYRHQPQGRSPAQASPPWSGAEQARPLLPSLSRRQDTHRDYQENVDPAFVRDEKRSRHFEAGPAARGLGLSQLFGNNGQQDSPTNSVHRVISPMADTPQRPPLEFRSSSSSLHSASTSRGTSSSTTQTEPTPQSNTTGPFSSSSSSLESPMKEASVSSDRNHLILPPPMLSAPRPTLPPITSLYSAKSSPSSASNHIKQTSPYLGSNARESPLVNHQNAAFYSASRSPPSAVSRRS